MCLESAQIFDTHVIRRRSFVALLTGGVLGAALPRRIGAAELQTANRNGPITLNDYEFIPPEGWVVQRKADQFFMRNPQSGCLIQVFEPRAPSGSLDEISLAVFQKMYDGWHFQQTGE